MDRPTRDKFAASTPQTDLLYGEQACQETPLPVYEHLNTRYHFDVDLCANSTNARHGVHFGPGGMYPDALLAPWWQPPTWADKPHTARKTGFSNPPYGAFIPKILEKAIAEQAKGFTSVFLLPLRAAKWYRNLVLPYYTELWHVEQRLMFTYKGEPARDKDGKPCGALFDSIIVVYAPRAATWLPGFPPQRPNVWNPKTGELKY